MGRKSYLARLVAAALVAGSGGALLAPSGLLAAGTPAAPPPAVEVATANLTVAGQASPPGDSRSSGPQPAPTPDRPAGAWAVRASGPGATVPAPKAGGAAVDASARAGRRRSHSKVQRRRRARTLAAASNGVSIQGFAFHPPSISVSVGDAVTWTNSDSVAHTATATGGAFNTGTLKQGQSASHTFTRAGTFAYICAIHPNMHGTIVVRGAAAGGGSSGGSSGSSGSSGRSGSARGTSGSSAGPGSAAAAPKASGPSLPKTGLGLLGVVLIAAALLLSGGLLCRLTRA